MRTYPENHPQIPADNIWPSPATHSLWRLQERSLCEESAPEGRSVSSAQPRVRI